MANSFKEEIEDIIFLLLFVEGIDRDTAKSATDAILKAVERRIPKKKRLDAESETKNFKKVVKNMHPSSNEYRSVERMAMSEVGQKAGFNDAITAVKESLLKEEE